MWLFALEFQDNLTVSAGETGDIHVYTIFQFLSRYVEYGEFFVLLFYLSLCLLYENKCPLSEFIFLLICPFFDKTLSVP